MGEIVAVSKILQHIISFFIVKKVCINFFLSTCSGFAAAVLSTPADVIKTRIMSNPDAYKGVLDCFLQAVSVCFF